MHTDDAHRRGGPGAPAPLLDREDETALLRLVARDALEGVGRLVVVEGPAGIGKSRLLDEAATLFRAEAAERAERSARSTSRSSAAAARARPHDVRVLRATGDELHRHRALGLVRALRDAEGPGAPGPTRTAEGADVPWSEPLLDGAGTPGPPRTPERTDVPGPAPLPDGGASAVQGALVDLAAIVGSGGSSAALLLFDDVHWADVGSLRVLEELAALLPRLPLAVVIATRPHEDRAGRPLLDRLRARAGGAYLRPAPLSAEAVRRLAAGASATDRPGEGAGRAAPPLSPSALETLVRRSGGNPFHVRELLRAGVGEDVPDAVRHAVRVDLERLPPAAEALARAVAVLGAGVPLRTASALAELDPRAAEEAADDLARTGVLRPGEPLAFEHALIAEAVGAELEPFARARLHRRAAGLLHEHGAPVEAVAGHLLHARADGDPWVAEVLLRAARATNAAGDPVAAGRLLERARREPPPAALQADVVGALAEAGALAGRADAADRLHEALALIDDPRRRAELRYALSRAFHLAQRFDDAVHASRDALEGLAPDDPLYDRVLSGWMTDALFVPDLRPAADPRVAAVTRDIRAGATAAGPLVAHAVNLAALDDAPGSVVLDLARRATSIDPVVDAAAHGFPITHLTTGLVHADLLEEAVEVLGDVRAAAAARSNVLAEMAALGGLAYAHHLRGDLPAATSAATRAFAISRASDTPYSAWWILVLVEARLDAGDVDEARAALALADEVTIPAYAGLRVREAAAAVHLAGGDAPAAVAVAEASERERRQIGSLRLSLGSHEGRWTLAHALVAQGRPDEARALADDERARTAGAAVGRHRAEGLALAGVVRGAEGVAPLEEAVALLRRSPARILLLRALLALGLARRAAGDAAGARDVLLEALELADRLDLPRRADEVRAALWTVGARPRRAAQRGREALTSAELDVAHLAAEGLANPAIAARRHVSRKTVETHLGRVYRKLGIASRGQLTAALADAERDEA